MDLHESNVWYLIFVISMLAVLLVIVLVQFEGRKKRMLANKIPGPAGSFLIGSLPLLIQGPERSIPNVRKVYRM